MFNNVALDVVIGLVFVYLLYSLLLTIIQELIANRLSYRAKFLEKAIVRMLEDDQPNAQAPISVRMGLQINTPAPAVGNAFAELFYQHPLIRYLGERPGRSKPSYLVSATFSKVIVDMLRGDNVLPGEDIRHSIQQTLDANMIRWQQAGVSIKPQTLQYIKSIWVDAQGDVERFRALLENWFDETMDRTTGWYKQYAQLISLIIGFVIAVAFNVDTLSIANKLQKDPELRAQIVQQADAFLKSHPNLDQELNQQKAAVRDSVGTAVQDSIQRDTLVAKREKELNAQYVRLKQKGDSLQQAAADLVQKDLKATNEVLGIGLGSLEWLPCKDCGWWERFGMGVLTLLRSLVGWIITALALSLGAPFWFDLLNKLMRLRTSVAPASDDPKQKQTSPGVPTIKRVG